MGRGEMGRAGGAKGGGGAGRWLVVAAAAGGLLGCSSKGGSEGPAVGSPDASASSTADAGAHEEGRGDPPPDDRFQKVTLNGGPGEPIGLAVLPDGRVLHTSREGRIFLHEPSTGFNRVIAEIPVYSHDEEGLQGLAIDPSFEENGWLYLYYSPPLGTPLDDSSTPDFNEGDAPLTATEADVEAFRGMMRLSRFRLENDQIPLASEQILLEVPVDRGICCHVGGDIDFDSQGNLLLSTGDDSNPFDSDFAPIDERMDRHPAFDAQRSSANTNDLRGKLLRIRVQEDGSYSIPEGNLFAPGTPQARPEIYAMGLRNPYRFSVDRKTDVIYLADYSPDASEADPQRGPAGQGKWMAIRAPGNYGWPYCATRELPYVDYDFATGESGAPFDCAAPVNDSPRNTGLRELPPVVQPELWYSAAESERFPDLGAGGVAPMAGPVYHFDQGSESRLKWPRYFDGLPIFYEWSRDALFEMHPGAPGELDAFRRLFSELVTDNPIDMEFGPDGALYMLEYGDGFNLQNPDAQLSRIDYVQGNFTPVPVVNPPITYAAAPPFSLQLSSDGTLDPDGDAITLSWDFDQDGQVDSTEPNPTATFDDVGTFAPSLRVVDSTGRAATGAVRVVVGNIPPVLTFLSPQPGQAFQFGQPQRLAFEVLVEDDQPVDCARVQVDYFVAHDMHGHGISQAFGCSGSFEIPPLNEEHAGEPDVAGGLRALYTDNPGPGLPALQSAAFVILPPTLGDAGVSPPAPSDAGAPDASLADAGAP